ncbi:MAG: phosphoribosylformylglycinamidine synthase subunit PurL [Candidatus Latescibacteria bacterium]|nr:phosphoribosylformylglycinamidine synthase subunit PurL [bacterium]MBD3424692.1 phosphoribosylformylglycinamidine synthase subunit PurL [Candidatus Latescibacterota bacterium]
MAGLLEGTLQIKGKPDSEIKELLSEHGLNITVDEARRVVELVGRDPTMVELTIFNTMWSEHCSYKSSKEVLKEFLPVEAPNVVMGPGEDAGVIRFAPADGDDYYCLVIAHESHNHPSQVLPFEGAATGIGGIVRDVYCMGAEVVGVLDPLRFGDPDGDNGRQAVDIARGVIDGIAQYGNPLGVPNLGGDVMFDEGYDENCLVNVVAVGLVKESRIIRSRVPEEASRKPYRLVLVGKPTDESGFGGAAFASEDLGEEEETDRGAVQVPDPFLKRVLAVANREVLDLAAEKGIKIGFKDLGAGGIACVTSEMADAGGFGVRIDLDRVNLAAGNYPPAVISCSETQERYCLAVPEDFVEEVLEVYNRHYELPHLYHGAGAFDIGEVTDEPVYCIECGGKKVCETPVEVITTGISYDRERKTGARIFEDPELDQERSLEDDFRQVLSSPDIASKNYVFRHYDQEVQGRAVLRPGEADAGVIAPVPSLPTGLAFTVDGNHHYGKVDPYQGGALAVCEAARNVAAVGGVPSAVTDCLNYGNPENPEVFWEFREGVRGVGDACRGIGLIGEEGQPIPVVSGNVSFYNQGKSGRAIPPTPIIACVGVVEDYSRSRSISFKQESNELFLIGTPLDELGGSQYYRIIYNTTGGSIPQADFIRERNQISTVLQIYRLGLIKGCHDIGSGGLITTLAEMAVASERELGVTVDLAGMEHAGLSPEKLLFSETGGFVIETPPGHEREILAVCARNRVNLHRLGSLIPRARLKITSGGDKIASWEVPELREIYMTGCREIFGK